jgi:hypothetical protein
MSNGGVSAPIQTTPGFWKARKVIVTGGAGFLGRVVVEKLTAEGAIVHSPRSVEVDLTKVGSAEKYFAQISPSHVIHLAARDNLLMGTYVIEAARATGVEKTVLLGTVCSYPKFTPVPFNEKSLWDGYPEETNAPYGIAKKAHLIHAQVNAQQYGQRFAYLIPTNLYGPGDKFHPSVSHVIPALIKKCVEAKERVVSIYMCTTLPTQSCVLPKSTRAMSRSTSVMIMRSQSRKLSRPWHDSLALAAILSGTQRNPMANHADVLMRLLRQALLAGKPRCLSKKDYATQSSGIWPIAKRPSATLVSDGSPSPSTPSLH